MAFSRNAARMRWLLIGPLALQPALLSAAIDAAAKGLDRTAESLLAQAPGPADAAIPMEVQGWADSAVAAYVRGDPAAGGTDTNRGSSSDPAAAGGQPT